jgi:hypothetical protein
MGSFPGGHTVFDGSLLIDGNVLADALAIGRVAGLVGTLDSGRKAEPVVCLHIVTGNSHANGIEQAEAALRAGIALVCGLAIPADRLGHVPQDTAAVPVEIGEVDLGLNVPLIGGFLVPLAACL